MFVRCSPVNPPPPDNPRSPRRPWDATCLKCGYSLKGITRPVCPECGTTWTQQLDQPATRARFSWKPRLLFAAQSVGLLALFVLVLVRFQLLPFQGLPRFTFGLSAMLHAMKTLLAILITGGGSLFFAWPAITGRLTGWSWFDQFFAGANPGDDDPTT